MKNTQPSKNRKSSESISFNPLNFEEALENLLKIRPIENKSLTEKKGKQKTKPKK